MLTILKQFHAIFTKEERRSAYLLFFPMVLSAIINVIGIAFVVPFITIVAQPQTIMAHKKIAWLYTTLHFSSTHKFLLFVGMLVLIVLAVGNGIGALTTWLMLKFTNMRSFTLSKRLLENYLKQPYVYFLSKNSATLAKNILSEVDTVVVHVLRHLFDMLSRSFAMFFVLALLFLVNPVLAICIAVVLGGAYMLIYAFVRRRLSIINDAHALATEQRFRIANETFGGIKEIKLQGCENVFLESYAKPASDLAIHAAMGQIISDLPRYALEVIAFGGIVLIVLYLLATNSSVNDMMPLLALYAFAGYRLMPGLQAIFGALTSIKAHTHALEVLYHDMVKEKWPTPSTLTESDEKLCFKNKLSLRSISYNYPRSQKIILNNLTITINAGESIGIVGSTGAGKTTLVDIILGLLEPTAGNCIVDDVAISSNNLRQWQANLGYVPQHIYLSDDTIANNIAFGIERDAVDLKRVEQAAKLAALHDFIMTDLPSGYATEVGERGIRLSGGQRQRIGIARALYRDPQLLVFDEATSALDSITETQIMESIYNLSGKKTLIIIAHRLSTLVSCDKIIVLEKGAMQDIGTYAELIARNHNFQRLAKVTA